MDKAEDAVDKKADETAAVLEKHGANIDTAKKDHKNTDKKVKEDIDGCTDVRTYLLDADGTVRRLEADGDLKALDSTDKQRLDGILDDGKAWRPPTRKDREEVSVGDTHTGEVTSTKVDPYTDELGQATQLARYARNDYEGNNYAAGRYIDPDGRGESILVGYSKNSMHSERSIGYPVMHNDEKQSGLKEVFTERAPCQNAQDAKPGWTSTSRKPRPSTTQTSTTNQSHDTNVTSNASNTWPNSKPATAASIEPQPPPQNAKVPA